MSRDDGERKAFQPYFCKISTSIEKISIDSIEIMTTGRIELGATGRYVAANVKRLRAARGMSLRALSEALDGVGRKLSQDAINKIENGAEEGTTRQIRRVDTDDLVALAVVFGVSPAALLLPLTDSDQAPVEVTGGGGVPALEAWDWANGRRPLKLTPGKEQTELLEHQLYSLPPWLRDRVGPMNDAMRNLSSLRDPHVRDMLQQLTGMSVGEPTPLPEKYRRGNEGGDDG
ncbi:helix-turn-helix domain-containing protein [Streptomyces agglomeratus]|uniref:helix-turn-helix domain-containing protein n=1 Tax=Streptomyces agglomeratus TaxID=285458 RepID=UPI00114CC123|nr:helix-turn-helix domain-containing protein [Streptomyces agglomeratus]